MEEGIAACFRHDVLTNLEDADITVPCGENCEVALILNMLRLRKEALPFDFLSCCTPSMILEAFRNPTGFFPPMGSVTNWAGAGFGHYLARDPDEYSCLSNQFELRMGRVKKRLEDVKDGGRVLLVHSCCLEKDDQTPEAESRALLAYIASEVCPHAEVEMISFRPDYAKADFADYTQLAANAAVRNVFVKAAPPSIPIDLISTLLMRQHRAALCATFGFLSSMDIEYYPKSVYPHAKETCLEFVKVNNSLAVVKNA